jgi:cytochrome c oxidase subunit III
MSHDQADHGHDHPSFLAHHFDDPEQQFDAGKLGIWLFLVTEILFFSGMFCAYALYRSRNPEIFSFASTFLNTSLGAFNTGVLLFSSLTMAWGVRCAQLRQRGGLVICLALTLCCASIFLGVKAVEYTHKWDMGLLPAFYYQSQYAMGEVPHHAWVPFQELTGQAHMSYLTKMCILPGLIVIGFAVWAGKCFLLKDRRLIEVSGSMLLTALSFFVGVGIGKVFEAIEAQGKAGHGEHAVHAPADPSAHVEPEATSHLVSTKSTETKLGEPTIQMTDQKGGAGLFFSIYYCMTGVHAIHILGGMVVLTWLLVRGSKNEFHEQYFGPVDYVGLYWHLVDLIWIYLFPLLYLIR